MLLSSFSYTLTQNATWWILESFTLMKEGPKHPVGITTILVATIVRWDCLYAKWNWTELNVVVKSLKKFIVGSGIQKAMQLDVVEGLNWISTNYSYFFTESQFGNFISHLNEYQHEANRDSITSKPIFTKLLNVRPATQVDYPEFSMVFTEGDARRLIAFVRIENPFGASVKSVRQSSANNSTYISEDLLQQQQNDIKNS